MQMIRPITVSGRRKVGPVSLAWLAPTVILAAACATASTEATIDSSRLQENIQADAAGTGIAIDTVSCPTGRAPVVGDRFRCDATLAGGGTLSYDVTITSAQGAYSYLLAPGQLLDGDRAAALVTADVAASGPAFASGTVACPATVIVTSGQATFGCTLTLGGASTPITVRYVTGVPLSWSF